MKELFNDYVNSIETYIMFRIKQEAAKLAPELTAKGRTPIALAMGAPVEPPPEFVYESLKNALSIPQIHTYSTPKGEQFFLDAVAQRMKNRFGVELDSKTEIHSLIGSKEGLANIIRALINPAPLNAPDKQKDIILVPDPGYASYSQMVKTSGGYAYPVCLKKEDHYMPDMNMVLKQLKEDGFDEKKVKALVVNYPGNPTGAVASLDYLRHVVDFCKSENILLISDAAYCDLYFDEKYKPHSVFEVDGAKDIAVEFFSFSKPYSMTGFRLGWMCGNKDAVEMFGRMKSTIDTGLFKVLQKAGADILNSNAGDEYIKKSNKSFESKIKILIGGFKELGWKIDETSAPKATFYLWLPVPPKYKTSEDFTSALLKTSGIVAVPGSAFGIFGEGCFRISAVASDSDLKEAIDRMKKDGFSFS